MRAVSTVVDASLCLLLVSASAVTLAGTPVGDAGTSDATATPDSADETAELVATSTARVTYDSATSPHRRTAHDTLAGLLAGAVRVRADGRGRPDFVRSVTARVNRTLRRHTSPDLGVQVVARGLNNSAGDHVTAGVAPPPETDVHAARFDLRETRFAVRTWSA